MWGAQLASHVREPCSSCDAQQLQILQESFEGEDHVIITFPAKCSCAACEKDRVTGWPSVGIFGVLIYQYTSIVSMVKDIVDFARVADVDYLLDPCFLRKALILAAWLRPWLFIPSARHQLYSAVVVTVCNIWEQWWIRGVLANFEEPFQCYCIGLWLAIMHLFRPAPRA